MSRFDVAIWAQIVINVASIVLRRCMERDIERLRERVRRLEQGRVLR